MRPGVFAIVVWWMLAFRVPAMGQGHLPASETKRYDKITNELVAPCCWRETISIHRSPEALEMLEQVRQFVADGRSEEEIKSVYVARYGIRILAEPPGTTGRWLYLMPVALFVCLVFLASLRLQWLLKKPAIARPPVGPEFITRIRAETQETRM